MTQQSGPSFPLSATGNIVISLVALAVLVFLFLTTPFQQALSLIGLTVALFLVILYLVFVYQVARGKHVWVGALLPLVWAATNTYVFFTAAQGLPSPTVVFLMLLGGVVLLVGFRGVNTTPETALALVCLFFGIPFYFMGKRDGFPTLVQFSYFNFAFLLLALTRPLLNRAANSKPDPFGLRKRP